MPMDGFTLSFIARELRELLIGGRVDKISQPEHDLLLLSIRNQGANHKLLPQCKRKQRTRADYGPIV